MSLQTGSNVELTHRVLNMRWRTRIEEGAPNAVLFALAVTVIMITGGIIYVLFDSGSKFYRGFGCGADDFTPPQDWSEELKVNIKQAAIYDDGSITDPLWLDSICIVDWDENYTIPLSDPMIDTYNWDAELGNYDGNSSEEGIEFGGVVGPRIHEDRSYLVDYFTQNPEDWDSKNPTVPLSVITANENALILHQQNPDLARGWWETIWVWDDRATTDLDDDGVNNSAFDGSGNPLDNDIDGDGITNFQDKDIDNDGIPNQYDNNEYEPQLDTFGLLLAALTIIIIILAFFSPVWLPKLSIDTIEASIGPIRSGFGFTALIATLAMINPLDTNMLLLFFAFFVVFGGTVYAAEKKISYTIVALAIASLILAIRPIHAIQTGQSIAFGLSGVILAGSMSDSRNQAGEGTRALLDGDVQALAIVALALTIGSGYFDMAARVEGSLGEFLTQTWWKTDVRTVDVVTVGDDLHMGVNSLLQTTLQVALGALIIAIPIGLGTAIYLSEYAGEKTANVVKPMLELLAGIPSVVYGFFAFVVIAPIVVDVGEIFLKWGWIAEEPQLFNPLNGAIVVGVMITPLIASLSEDALRAVPDPLRYASYALGATPTETTARVTIPSALSGILASIILALSRAVGETMAVTLSVGTMAVFTTNMFRSAQTMTAYIAQRISGELPIGTTPYYSLFAVGFYLFFITLGLNLIGHRIMTRFREEYE